jgi:predicted aspartyl protease
MRESFRFFVTLALLLATGVNAAAPRAMTSFSGPSKCSLKFAVTSEGKAVVDILLEGERHTLFLDTGCTTVLDLAVARRLGLNPVESSEVATSITGIGGTIWLARVDMQIGEMKITGMPIGCLDLSGLRALNKNQGQPDLDGLVGADLLAILRAQIDYNSNKLTIRRPEHIP